MTPMTTATMMTTLRRWYDERGKNMFDEIDFRNVFFPSAETPQLLKSWTKQKFNFGKKILGGKLKIRSNNFWYIKNNMREMNWRREW